ncbi:TPA: hypothetical protein NID53_002698 [Pseudomonas aeruginosa]|nr:hypothetical protein [Pseudomonas aeruginosa]HEQ0164202.1 hypothetical protein [Pseudomonas aeruginosa]
MSPIEKEQLRRHVQWLESLSPRELDELMLRRTRVGLVICAPLVAALVAVAMAVPTARIISSGVALFGLIGIVCTAAEHMTLKRKLLK